jgi:hypothetical protein
MLLAGWLLLVADGDTEDTVLATQADFVLLGNSDFSLVLWGFWWWQNGCGCCLR